MARIEPLDDARATGRAREILDELAGRGREPGPTVRAMANATALQRDAFNRVAGIHPSTTARSAAA